MPSTRSAPTDTEPDAPTPARPFDEPRLGISSAQVAGSALAAVSGALLASWLGVTGTLVGAALGSVIGTVGSASYTYSLQRGHAVVRGTRPTRERRAGWREWPWKRLAAGGATALALGLVALTLVEGLTGQPVSSLTDGDGSGRTTIGQLVPGRDRGADTSPGDPEPAPVDPSQSPTADPTDGPTPEPTGSPSPTDEPVPTESPSPTPGGSPTPAAPSPSTTP